MQDVVICTSCCWWGTRQQLVAGIIASCPQCGNPTIGNRLVHWRDAFARRDARRAASQKMEREWDAIIAQNTQPFSFEGALSHSVHMFLLHYHELLPNFYMPSGRAHLALGQNGKPAQRTETSCIIDVIAWDPEYTPESLDVLRFTVWQGDTGHLDAEIITNNPSDCPDCLRAKGERWEQLDPMGILPPQHIRWTYPRSTGSLLH